MDEIGHGATILKQTPKIFKSDAYIYIYACVYIHSLYLEKQSPAISITGYNGLLRWFLFGGNPSGPFVASRVMGHTGTT